jgi:transcriptional regulator with XRE-family HTH domain
MNKFAEQLKKLRRERKLSQKKLAEIAGLGDVQISTYENGKVIPTRSSLINLANALKVPITFFDDSLAYPEATISRDELLKEVLHFTDLKPSYLHSRMLLEMLKALSNNYKSDTPVCTVVSNQDRS